MSSEGGIWVDIFARLNMASANAVVNELRSIMRRAGDDASKSFGEHAAGMDAMKRQYREMADAANASYREMEIGLGRLQAAEADLNRVRAENYGMHARERIAAEKEFQAALVESQRLQRDAAADNLRSRNAGRDARDAAAADAVLSNGRPSDSVDRGRGAIVIPRGGNIAGWGVAGLTAIVGGQGLRQDTMIQRNMAPLQYQQNMSRGDVAGLTQQAYAISQATGLPMDQVTKAFAAGGRSNTAGGDRYQGQGLTDLVRRSAQLSRTSGGQMDLDEALKAIRTTSHDYQMRDTGAVGGMLSRALAGNAHSSDLAEALHSIEPMASAAKISPQEILAALNSVSQTGQTNEQTAQNLNSVLQGWAKPSGIVSQSMQQLGINPQDISTNLSQRGIGGTIDVFNKAFSQNLGPNGTVVIDAMKRASMMQDQQDLLKSRMSEGAQKFVDRQDVQMGMVSPFKARAELLKSGGFPGMTPQDEQLIEQYINEQHKLNGPSDMLRRNQPLVQNILGAVGATSTREAGRTLTQLGMGVDPESQNRLKQFKDATKDIQGGSSGQSLDDSFHKSMDTTSAQLDKMKESFKNAESKMTNSFLPALGHAASAFEKVAGFFDRHQTAATALFDAMAAATGIFLAIKAWNMATTVWNGLTNAMNATRGFLVETGTAVRNVGTNAARLASTEATATTEVATLGASAETTAAEMKGSGIGAALKGAAATIGEVFSKGAMLAILGNIVGGSLDQAGIPNPGDALKNLPGQKDKPDVPSWMQDPGWLNRLKKTPLLGGEGHSRGGIVGYSGGTGDAGSQPLMGQPDMGGDSILGMVGGKPIGLRGGEGILTPETVQRLGGKQAIDEANSGGNPWANPRKVSSTFYNSFAKGVAKYSPWGKFFEAAGQSIESMQSQSDEAQAMNFQADPEMLMMGMPPGMSEGGGGERAYRGGHHHHGGHRGHRGGSPSGPPMMGGSAAPPSGGSSYPRVPMGSGSAPSGPSAGIPSTVPSTPQGDSSFTPWWPSGSSSSRPSQPSAPTSSSSPSAGGYDFNAGKAQDNRINQGVITDPSSDPSSGSSGGSGLGGALGGAPLGGPGGGDSSFAPWWTPGSHHKPPDFNSGSGGGSFDLPAPLGRTSRGTPLPYTGDLGGTDPNPSLDKSFMGGGGGFAGGGTIPHFDTGGVIPDNGNQDVVATVNRIISYGKTHGMPDSVIKSMIMAASQESHEGQFPTTDKGLDNSSNGIFQVRTDMHTGEPADKHHVGYKHNAAGGVGDYDSLDWWRDQWVAMGSPKNMDPATLAQSVEGSAFPDRYAQWAGQADKQMSGYADSVKGIKGGSPAPAPKPDSGGAGGGGGGNFYRKNYGTGGGGGNFYQQWYPSGGGGGGQSLGSSYLQAAGNMVSHPLGSLGDSIGSALGFSKGGVVPGFDMGGLVSAPPPPPAPTPAPPAAPPAPGLPSGAGPSMAPQTAQVPGKQGYDPLSGPNGPKPPTPADTKQGQAVQKPDAKAPATTPAKPKTPPHGQDKAGPHPDHSKRLTPAGTPAGVAPKAGGDRNVKENPSRPGGTENTSKGFGVGGGIIGAAESMGSMMAGPGAAGAQAGFQLINRAIGYGGQLLGIGMEGLIETFLPNDSKLGDPTNNLLGKMALGIAGAHPGGDNMAGKSAMAMQPKQDLDQGAMSGKQMPDIHINGDVHNHGQQEWDGLQKTVSKATFGGLPVGGQG